MHEQSPILIATPRQRLGSRHAARTRRAGQLPAVVYGHGQPPVPVALEARTLLSYLHRGEKVFRLRMNGQDALETVLLKEVQYDYLGTHVIHVDFVRVSLTDRVTVRVPVHLIGDAPGLKTAGAILMHPLNELEIECRVTDIPDRIDVDISGLDSGHAIHAGDVKLPATDMRLKTDPRALVAQIVIQHEPVAAPAAEAAAVEAAPAEPEVITARKKEEEGEEAPVEGKPAPKAAAREEKGKAAAREDKGKEKK